jgi:hypothetical protein
VIEVRAILLEVRDVPVPEPSAGQMARLSARVREAVASEGNRWRAPRLTWWRWWSGRMTGTGRAGWAWGLPIAAVAVLTLAIVGSGVNRSAPVVVPVSQAAGPTGGSKSDVAPVVTDDPAVEPRELDTPDDPSLGLMFDLAAGINLDADPAPVLAMGAGTLDGAVGDLSPDEQHELERLLNEAMKSPGA